MPFREHGEFSALPGEELDPDKLKKANARLKESKQERTEKEKLKAGEGVAEFLPPDAGKIEGRTQPPA